jgi:uncharacterized membrane protein
MDKHQAIYKLYPNVTVIRGDVAYDKDEQEVTYDNNAVEALMAANAYKEARATAYAPLSEQLDMQYWDAMNNTETWLDHIRSVKAAHPKEGE